MASVAQKTGQWLIDQLTKLKAAAKQRAAEISINNGHLMTENALLRAPPIGLFRDLVIDKKDNCIDIKLHGLALLVDCARILGLAAGSRQSTAGLAGGGGRW